MYPQRDVYAPQSGGGGGNPYHGGAGGMSQNQDLPRPGSSLPILSLNRGRLANRPAGMDGPGERADPATQSWSAQSFSGTQPLTGNGTGQPAGDGPGFTGPPPYGGYPPSQPQSYPPKQSSQGGGWASQPLPPPPPPQPHHQPQHQPQPHHHHQQQLHHHHHQHSSTAATAPTRGNHDPQWENGSGGGHPPPQRNQQPTYPASRTDVGSSEGHYHHPSYPQQDQHQQQDGQPMYMGYQQPPPPPPPPQQQGYRPHNGMENGMSYAQQPQQPQQPQQSQYQQTMMPPYGSSAQAQNWGESYDEGNQVVEEELLDAEDEAPYHPHTTDGQCGCGTCALHTYMVYVHRKQRQASRQVMSLWPSPHHAQTNGLPPVPVDIPSPGLSCCPVFEETGFCPYSSVCYLPHVPNPRPSAQRWQSALVLPAASADEELQRIIKKAQVQRETEQWTCWVCGLDTVDESARAIVGVAHYFRQCPRCNMSCYFPCVTYLVEHVLESVGDDYQEFKTQIEHYRRQVPDEFKVPLSFEAFRIATNYFAWSLVSPADLRDAMDAASRILPDLSAVVSMGSSTGYVEHVLNRVMHPGVPVAHPGSATQRRLTESKFSPTAFDGVRTNFYGLKQVPIFAFDDVSIGKLFSVHVSIGGPSSILSLQCDQAVLLLCWPSFGSPEEEQTSMAFESLECFTQRGGRVVIYIGDVSATGDWRFHRSLFSNFKLVKEYPVRRELRRWSPEEMGYVYGGADTIGVYERRVAPVPVPADWTCSM